MFRKLQVIRNIIWFIFFLVLTRLSMLLIFGIQTDSYLTSSKYWNDGLHHYQIGALLLFLSILLSLVFRNFVLKLLCLFALALVIEEYAVIFNDLNIPHFHYLTIAENIVFFSFVFFFTIFFLLITKDKKSFLK